MLEILSNTRGQLLLSHYKAGIYLNCDYDSTLPLAVAGQAEAGKWRVLAAMRRCLPGGAGHRSYLIGKTNSVGVHSNPKAAGREKGKGEKRLSESRKRTANSGATNAIRDVSKKFAVPAAATMAAAAHFVIEGTKDRSAQR